MRRENAMRPDVAVRRRFGSLLLPFVVGVLQPAALGAQEYFIHANGDSINADIKGFERGKLKYEIPGSSSASIEFTDVATLASPDDWDVELTRLRRLFGSISAGPDSGRVRIATATDTVEVGIAEIVRMTSVNRTVWSRLDGFVELGFNFARANNATNLNFATRLDYRAPGWFVSLALDSRFQDQDDAESFKRNQARFGVNYLFPRTWYAGAFTQLEQNQQLDLDLRLLIGAVAGRDILQSNRVQWNWLAGVLSNREDYGGLDATTSAEALLGTRFSWFTFGDWENDLASSLFVYPSLSESGRLRMDFDVSYRQDLFGDLYLRLSFYDQYDSDPPAGVAGNDYGTSVALGWDV